MTTPYGSWTSLITADAIVSAAIGLGQIGLDGENLAELDGFLTHPFVSVAFLSRVTADRFGRIASALKRSGSPIPTNDMWIAAQALELGAELVTFDEHFTTVPGLVALTPGR